MEIAIRDALYVVSLVIAVAASHYTLRAKVMVLEERVAGHTEMFERIERSLRRIEEKLDGKADR